LRSNRAYSRACQGAKSNLLHKLSAAPHSDFVSSISKSCLRIFLSQGVLFAF
jgi:hypothetical protein